MTRLLILASVLALAASVPAVAGKPTAPGPAAPPPAFVVDANGAVVGPVVPVLSGIRVGALYRSGSDRIKVLFFTDRRFNGGWIGGALGVDTPIELYFPTPDCSGPTAYIMNPGAFSETDGYTPAIVVRRGTGAVIGKIDGVGVRAVAMYLLSYLGQCVQSGYNQAVDWSATVTVTPFPFAEPFTVQ